MYDAKMLSIKWRKKMKMSGKILAVALALAMLMFAGCAKEESNTVKIGGIFPLSGDVAVYGVECRNGVEMASGAVRNHDIEIMKKAFAIAGYGEDEIKNRFKALYEAFKYGAPPHAGMAPGIDRILMMLLDQESIRETVAFPLAASGADFLMGAPGDVEEIQLREAHIKVR